MKMSAILWTAAAVFVGIWAWSRFASPAAKKKLGPAGYPLSAFDMTTPVDSGMFYGPEIDRLTGAYTGGASAGAVNYSSQPVGVA